MKTTHKILFAAAAFAAASVSANAQSSLLAGWSFSNVPTGSAAFPGTISSDYGTSNGTLYFDGSHGAASGTEWGIGQSNGTLKSVLKNTTNYDYASPNQVFPSAAADSIRFFYNGNNANNNPNNKAFVFGLNTAPVGFAYDNLTFDYFAIDTQISATPVQITWSWSTNGTDYTQFAVHTIGTTAQNYGASLTDVTGTNIYIQGVITGLSGTGNKNLALDTVRINGEQVAVPEPSTYALILGGLGLGFVVIRRRASKRA